MMRFFSTSIPKRLQVFEKGTVSSTIESSDYFSVSRDVVSETGVASGVVTVKGGFERENTASPCILMMKY